MWQGGPGVPSAPSLKPHIPCALQHHSGPEKPCSQEPSWTVPTVSQTYCHKTISTETDTRKTLALWEVGPGARAKATATIPAGPKCRPGL